MGLMISPPVQIKPPSGKKNTQKTHKNTKFSSLTSLKPPCILDMIEIMMIMMLPSSFLLISSFILFIEDGILNWKICVEIQIKQTVKKNRIIKFSLSRHSFGSTVQSSPVQPAGHVHIWIPVMGDVSHFAPAWHGLLTQASSRWHRSPAWEVNSGDELSHFKM